MGINGNIFACFNFSCFSFFFSFSFFFFSKSFQGIFISVSSQFFLSFSLKFCFVLFKSLCFFSSFFISNSLQLCLFKFLSFLKLNSFLFCLFSCDFFPWVIINLWWVFWSSMSPSINTFVNDSPNIWSDFIVSNVL